MPLKRTFSRLNLLVIESYVHLDTVQRHFLGLFKQFLLFLYHLIYLLSYFELKNITCFILLFF